jgi:ABC-type Fe3+ transport system substrate-binding protein
MRAFKILALTISLSFFGTAYGAPQDRLVLVSPHWEGIRYEFEAAFKKHHLASTGREVVLTWLDVGGTSEILRYVRSEFTNKPESIGIDIVFGGGIDPFLALKREQLLQPPSTSPLNPEVALEVAGTQLHDPDNYFFAPTMAVFGFICNHEVLRQIRASAPRNWNELGRPELHSWIGSGDPRRSGSTHMAYEIILQAYGWEVGWKTIYELGTNIRSFAANSLQVAKDVANGELACGLAIDSQATALIRLVANDSLEFIVPEGLSVINGDGVAILKGAPNLQAAESFLTFLFSKTAQSLWSLPVGSVDGPKKYQLSRLSVMPATYSTPLDKYSFNPFLFKNAIRYDFNLGASRWGLINDLLGIFVIDNHTRLKTYRPSEPPIPEQDMQELLLSTSSQDPIQHAKLLHAWELRAAELIGGKSRVKQVFISTLLLLGVVVFVVFNRRTSSRRGDSRTKTGIVNRK